eukprot:Nk52_evm28s62 gene=Nk52_evmTU28s62
MCAENVQVRHCCKEDLEEKPLERLTGLINEVYNDAESGMWKPGAQRCNIEEVKNLVEQQRLILAFLGGNIVGSIQVCKMDDDTVEFGMLVADMKYRNIGIGRKLVAAAEGWAKSVGASTMRLELLTPRNWDHPSKEFLKKWYTRLGYKPTHTEPFEKMFAHLVDQLCTDCDFTVWLKRL